MALHAPHRNQIRTPSRHKRALKCDSLEGVFLLTTDVAPEVETPTLVTQDSPPVDDAAPVGDAGQQDIADATPSTPDAEGIDYAAEAAAAYQEEMAGKGSDTAAPEPEQAQGVDMAMAERATALHRQQHAARQKRADAYEQELLDQGLPDQYVKRLVKEFKDILNEEHADGYNYAGYGTAAQERVAMLRAVVQSVPQAIQTKVIESLKPAEGQPQPTPAKVFEAMLKAVADDAATKADKAAFERGFIKGRSQGERTQSSAKSGQQVQGDPASGGKLYSSMTPQERNSLTPEQRDAAVARERQARGG